MVNLNTKKIVTNTAWMLFDKVFMILINLLVTVKIANHFGVSEYGNYQYAVNIVAILEILVTFVDGRVVKKRYLNTDAELLVVNATICRVIFSLISVAVGLVFIFAGERGCQFNIMFLILLLNVIFVNLRFGMANRFEYLLKSKKTVIATDISSLISSILQLIAVKMNWSIISISVIVAISSIINFIIVFIQYRIEFKGKRIYKGNKVLIREMILESLPLAIAASCATIYTRCDTVMLGSMLTTVEVGVYSISVKMISVVQIAISPIRESIYPKMLELYSLDKKKYEYKYIQISSMMTWMYIIGVLLSFVVLPYFLSFFDAEYAEAFSVYRLLVVGTFFMYNAALRAGHFTLINKGNILMYSQILSVVVNIILNIVGIRLWGMYGAAISTIVTQGISLMFSNYFFGKEGKQVLKWQLQALNPLRIFKYKQGVRKPNEV
jgi:O-antigen/teichoic acid export membrane protein